MLKKNKLRYNEYYDMQHIYDELYAQSKNGNNFYKLLEIIGSEQNLGQAGTTMYPASPRADMRTKVP